MATALSYPSISGVTGAPYISALGDTANIQDTINYLYYGSTKAVSATDGLYGMLTKLQTQISAVQSGVNVHESAKFATTTTLAATYTAGTTDASGGTGIGATITFSSTGVQKIDSTTINLALNDRVLVKDGTTALSGTSSIANGIYYVSTAPAVGVAGILTRALDSDNSIAGEMAEGDFLYVSDGDTNANKGYILTTSSATGTGPAGSIKIGTDSVTYTQFVGVGSYYIGTTAAQISATSGQALAGIASVAMISGGGGTFTLSPASSASSFAITLPAAADTLIGKATTDVLTNKSLSDSTTYFVDNSDNTKRVNIDVTGTTGITGILQTAFTTAKTIAFPDIAGTVYVSTGTDVSLADGGTNASLTASNGGIVYSTATALAILSGTATAGKLLQSGSSTTPSWTTSTYADTYAANSILYASSANTVTGLALGTANQVLTVNAGGTAFTWATPSSGSLGYLGTTQTTASSAGTSTLAGVNTFTPSATASITPSSVATSPGIGISITGGDSTKSTTPAVGGSVTITGGAQTNATPTGTGGAVAIAAGAGGTNGQGGALTLDGGAGGANGGGNVTIRAGSSASGNGSINIGTSNTAALTIGASGITTTINGTLTSSGITGPTATSLAISAASTSGVGNNITINAGSTGSTTQKAGTLRLYAGTATSTGASVANLGGDVYIDAGVANGDLGTSGGIYIGTQFGATYGASTINIGYAGTPLTLTASGITISGTIGGHTLSGTLVGATTSTTLAPLRLPTGTVPLLANQQFGQIVAAAESLQLATTKTSGAGPGFGYIRAPQMVYTVANTNTVTTNTAASVFDTANDILSSLEVAKAYRFRGTYYVTSTFTSGTATIQLLFAFANAPVAFKYNFKTYKSSGTAMDQVGLLTTNAASSVSAGVTATATYVIEFEGFFTSNATTGGTLTPQIQMSGAGSSTVVNAGSWFEVEKLGTSTQTLIAGNWG